MPAPPLIVTLHLDHESQDYFNGLRKKYFPPEINYLNAHLTLFHHLPSNEPKINKELGYYCERTIFDMNVAMIFHTGFGVAFRVHSPEVIRMHAYLQETFTHWLTPQDRRSLQPHITIQNKAGAQESKQLCNDLQKDFVPFTAIATGVDTWLYRNGPWEHVEFFAFKQPVLKKDANADLLKNTYGY